MSKKGGGKSGGSKRDGGALYKGMAIKLSDIVVGDTLGALQPYLLPAPRRWDLVSRRAWDLCTRPEYRACLGRARAVGAGCAGRRGAILLVRPAASCPAAVGLPRRPPFRFRWHLLLH